MPRVPMEEQRVGIAPLPNAQLTAAPTAEALGANLGKTTSQLGLEMYRDALYEADQTAFMEADRKASELQTATQLKVLNLKGKDAMAAPDLAQQEFSEGTAKIEQGLNTDRQRRSFMRAKHARSEALTKSTLVHTYAEIEKYKDTETDLGIKAARNAAALNAGNPEAVLTEQDRTAAYVHDLTVRKGIPADSAAYQELQVEAQSALNTHVIDSLLARGQDRTAQQFYTDHPDGFTAAQREHVETKLKGATTEGAGMRTADAVWRDHGPKTLNDPVLLSVMQQAIRDTHPDDPKIVKAALADMAVRAAAHNAEQVEVTASNKATVLKAFNENTPLTALLRMPEYLALSGTEQEVVKRHVVETGYTLEQRAKAEVSYAHTMEQWRRGEITYQETEKARKGFATYWTLSDPKVLAAMSENQILALRPTLGRELTERLMLQKRSVEKPAEATLDPDLFKELAHGAGLRPYDPHKSEDEQAALGQLKNNLEKIIDQEQQRKGGKLSRSEKETIILRELDKKVMIDTFGPGGTAKPILMVTPKEREQAYTPIEQIPPAARKKMLNMARGWGAIMPETTDAQAEKVFASRLEKAHAAAQLGAADAEIKLILTGKK